MARRKQRPFQQGKNSGPSTSVGFPVELEETLKPFLGDEVELLKRSLLEPSPISIRINPLKSLETGGDVVPWCRTGRYLKERPSFTFDPLFHAGAYYVQEASSMFLEQAFNASGFMGDIIALDLAAAPGGKSTHLRSLLTTSSLLVANEIDRHRVQALQENLWKWGHPNVVITNSDPSALEDLEGFFDLIVLDAPCSGEGMFRKDPFALQQWSPRLVEQCARTQQRILPFAWEALVPGGVLIYSTCTWEPQENEHQLRPLLERGAAPIDIDLRPEWHVERSLIGGVTGYRFYPHRTKCEGFFLAVLRKAGEWVERPMKAQEDIDPGTLPFLKKGAWYRSEQNGVQHVVEERWRSSMVQIQKGLRTLAPGIPVAEPKGNELVPHPALALNTMLDIENIQVLELDHDQAIAYLKGNPLPSSGGRGHALATYQKRPLGWVKGTGDRWNNRWPANWRIRSHRHATTPVQWPQTPDR
jgi:16S rRNA C967 or C1407 C5-methylase (RsmB/RsmF family)/NOL1/NOP2/fmu family ribosome biogenesis protein